MLALTSLILLLIAFPGWIRAQLEATVALSTALETPVLGWSAKRLTEAPTVRDEPVAASPTTVVASAGRDRSPSVVLITGASRDGRANPTLQRLARGLGRVGYRVFVPDLPGLRRATITPRTLAATIDLAERAAARSSDGRVALVGVSTGATLGLLAAADPRLAGRVSVVSGIAPFTDIVRVLRLGTTGAYREQGRLMSFPPDPFLKLVLARSLIAMLGPVADRDELLERLEAVPDDARDPLAALRELSRQRLGPEARAAVALLVNRDPERFDRLYAELPQRVRRSLEQLSPIEGPPIEAQVELASAPQDKYFPLAESRAVAAIAPRHRVTVTAALRHADPTPSLRELPDLVRLDAYVLRTLRAAR